MGIPHNNLNAVTTARTGVTGRAFLLPDIMPFSGIEPGSKLERDIDDCVTSIRADNPWMGKSQAIAICRSRLETKMNEQEKEIKASELGSFLRRQREKMELSLEDVAKRSPITAGTIGDIETGVIETPSLPVLRAFAKVYKVTLSRLEGMLGADTMPAERVARNKGIGERRHPDDEHEKRGDEVFAAFGATSFAEIIEAERAQEAAQNVRLRASQVPKVVEAILIDPNIEDKEAALQELGPEFSAIVAQEMERKERWQPLTDAVVNAISPLIDKQKPMKTEGGIRRPAEDFAFVPDPEKPSTWKLPLTETAGKITRDKLGDAAAAFSPGGFRGNPVQIPAASVAAVKAKIRAAYRKIGVKDEDIPSSVRKELQSKNSFMVYKETDGGYRWLAIYSNKFRDRDNPPEIISEASHRRFTKMVNSGEVPYPELWLWHVKGSRWGEADFVGYDDNGFAVATGTVDKGKEWVAESLMNNGEEMLTSHGMPPSSIKRDHQDQTIYIEHVTKEISPLLARVAANEFTGFSILGSEVKQMAFTEEERARLNALGVDPDTLEAQTADKAKETEDLESKETGKSEGIPETSDFVSRDEVTDLVKSVAESTNQLVQVVGDLANRIEILENNKLNVDKETLERTPAASLTDLYQSTIGSKEARIDGRTALARSGPEEAEPGPSSLGGIAGVIARRNQEVERGGVQ